MQHIYTKKSCKRERDFINIDMTVTNKKNVKNTIVYNINSDKLFSKFQLYICIV